MTSEIRAGQYLSFIVGGDYFGIDTKFVSKITSVQERAKMPDGIPVVCLRRSFKKSSSGNVNAHVIIVSADGRELGLAVDAISETVEITHSDIMPGGEPSGSYITGVARLPGGRIAVLLCVERLVRRASPRPPLKNFY